LNHYEIFALQSIKGIGDVAIAKILGYCAENQIASLLGCDFTSLSKYPPLSRYKKILSEQNTKTITAAVSAAKSAIQEWEERGVIVIPITSAQYPKRFLELDASPSLLFCRGNIGLLNASKTAAVIGTRNNTSEGKRIAEIVAKGLIKEDYIVVSGLALGIDAIAHWACIEQQASAIAIVVDVVKITPVTNEGLADKILAHAGLLLAENPPNIAVRPTSFIKRDRLQAALSDAIFPIETSIDGGTMHAVNAAKKLNKLIFIPSPKLSNYPNTNIKQLGGIMALSADPSVNTFDVSNFSELIPKL